MAKTKANMKSDAGSFAADTSSRVGELIQKFEQDFRSGTSDPSNFKSMDDLEAALSSLIGNTMDEYRKLAKNLAADRNEEEQTRTKSGTDEIGD